MDQWLITFVREGGDLANVVSSDHPVQFFKDTGKTVAFAVRVPDGMDLDPSAPELDESQPGRQGILKFNLPEQQEEFVRSQQGLDLMSAVDEHFNWLRTRIKYEISDPDLDRDVCETAVQDYKAWLIDGGMTKDEAEAKLAGNYEMAKTILASVRASLFEQARDNLSECLDYNKITRD